MLLSPFLSALVFTVTSVGRFACMVVAWFNVGDSIGGRRGPNAPAPRERGGTVHAALRTGLPDVRRQPAALTGAVSVFYKHQPLKLSSRVPLVFLLGIDTCRGTQ